MTLNDYRKGLTLSADAEYSWVSLGPVMFNGRVHKPESRWPFPTPSAANLFARNHKDTDPERTITVDYPDGRKWEVQ